jgi:hypothetical protein
MRRGRATRERLSFDKPHAIAGVAEPNRVGAIDG